MEWRLEWQYYIYWPAKITINMSPQEKAFTDYWSVKRKRWKWNIHTKKTFVNIVLPLVISINLVNYFIIGDTAYNFFSFTHLYILIKNTVLFSVLLILGSGIVEWNFNESRYWRIMRKYINKLQ